MARPDPPSFGRRRRSPLRLPPDPPQVHHLGDHGSICFFCCPGSPTLVRADAMEVEQMRETIWFEVTIFGKGSNVTRAGDVPLGAEQYAHRSGTFLCYDECVTAVGIKMREIIWFEVTSQEAKRAWQGKECYKRNGWPLSEQSRAVCPPLQHLFLLREVLHRCRHQAAPGSIPPKSGSAPKGNFSCSRG
ncbi:hypothetical protein ZWY2020_041283 [Hordeum vulgare]|nr:hypothetical protein ZWY2020_041283 [Hordeum vulgare]